MDVINVVEMLRRLGFERDLKPYPSLLLGAFDASPFEMAQVYASIASGGFRIPLRAIREVTDSNGQSLQHYSLDVEKAVESGPAYLITHAMQRVVKAGTASAAKSKLSPDLNLAGKTGTTDDYRDSWFAGFSGNRLAVVWLGRDDNKPTGFSGSSGALRVWIDLMAGLSLEPLDTPPPADVEEIRVDPRSGLRLGSDCGRGQPIPFLIGSGPKRSTSCSTGPPAARPARKPPSTPDDASESDGMSDFFRRLME
jgi:penicillin-binding protein 1B